MKRLVLALLLLTLPATSFLVGTWYQQSKDVGTHTSSTSTRATLAEADDDPGGEIELPSGSIRISPERQQLIGVRTGVVEKSSGEYLIRAVGRVVPDEKRVYRLVAGTDGWIRETFAQDTGTLVKKDERLATFYSPQFRAAQLAYFATLTAPEEHRHQQVGRPGLAPSQQASVTLQTYIDALESLGMTEKQLKELAASKQLTDRVYIMAPASGYIIARTVSPGQRFDKGFEWYQIANLDKVWILADLFPNDAGLVAPGIKARVIESNRGLERHAVVTKVLPQADQSSRTMKVRLELENPEHVLRPEMFVNVELPVARPPALTVLSDSIVDSGLRKTVFVHRGNGYFEPREVETGWRHGPRVEIKRGLEAGETIAISGTFLIDSESKLALTASGMQALLAKDPVCGSEVSPRKAEKAGLTAMREGKAYYFHAEDCRLAFRKEPGRFAEKMDTGASVAQTAAASAPVEHKVHAHK
jgi:RND family efflux transporter MFP subunit